MDLTSELCTVTYSLALLTVVFMYYAFNPCPHIGVEVFNKRNLKAFVY